MPHQPPDEVTRQRIRALIQANFAGRDDLYAAADAFDSETLTLICRKLAEDLAGNAMELQQIARAAGMEKVNYRKVGSQLQADLTEMLQQRGGDQAVLEEAQECEQLIRAEYDQAIAETESPAVEEVLRRQREKVEFGESVIQEVRPPEDEIT